MNNKRGQFYLLAAIIIIAVIISFAAYSNYVRKHSSVRVFDLGDELDIESPRVIDHGLYNSAEWTLKDLLENFTRKYSEYAESNIYFVFGDENSLAVASYADVGRGIVSVNLGEFTQSDLSIDGKTYKIQTYQNTGIGAGENIELTIGDVTHEFKLTEGQNFYYVISQEVGGEVYVETSE